MTIKTILKNCVWPSFLRRIKINLKTLISRITSYNVCYTKLLRFFGIEENELLATTRPKIATKGVDIQPKLTNKLVVDAEFSDYDKINLEFAKKGRDEEYEMSRNDVEKLFNYWSYNFV